MRYLERVRKTKKHINEHLNPILLTFWPLLYVFSDSIDYLHLLVCNRNLIVMDWTYVVWLATWIRKFVYKYPFKCKFVIKFVCSKAYFRKQTQYKNWMIFFSSKVKHILVQCFWNWHQGLLNQRNYISEYLEYKLHTMTLRNLLECRLCSALYFKNVGKIDGGVGGTVSEKKISYNISEEVHSMPIRYFFIVGREKSGTC